MKCPVCNKIMDKAREEISNNQEPKESYKEYDKVTYQCIEDDVWVVTETPVIKSKS